MAGWSKRVRAMVQRVIANKFRGARVCHVLKWQSWVAFTSLFILPAVVLAQAQMSTPGNFDVSPSGAAIYSIPIQVPPGTAGIQPKLALTYNSQHGNGIAGVGWSLAGLSSITYCPTTLLRNGAISQSGNYCLDGQRLVTIGTAPGTVEYRTANDSFSKITSDDRAQPAFFRVLTKSGLIMDYSPATYLGSPCHSNGVKGCPAVVSFITQYWVLSKITDRQGNFLTIQYGSE